MGRYDDPGKPVFPSTHRPLGNRQTGHSADQLAREASFDNAPAPGCIFLILTTICAAVIGVILGV